MECRDTAWRTVRFPPVDLGIAQAYLKPQLRTEQLRMGILVHRLCCPEELVTHWIQVGETMRAYEL